MRAGETMENSLRSVVKDCKMGKILIQTNDKVRKLILFETKWKSISDILLDHWGYYYVGDARM